ncbi:MAG: Ubiquinone biosynthesis protein coq9, mitochondrial [Icmadophila ericetorum]|nr:Ubiquinone biosynthesis protein coq9, mitochondrial [Icmadophila ericetorum]
MASLRSRTSTLHAHLSSQLFRPITSSQAASPRSYQSSSNPGDEDRPFTPAENAILSASLAHVSRHGFTSAALVQGARDAGYLDVSTNLFPRGSFDLVRYHLITQRLALRDRVQFPTHLGVGAKVRSLALQRLRANGTVIDRWQEALALMAIPSNIPPSLRELALLADEIWFLAGDTSVDSSWYSKRATLSAIYASTEVFMITDSSTDFTETEQFLDQSRTWSSG